MATPEGGSPLSFLLIQILLIGLIFYWLLIRPQKKERERHDAMIAGLKKGDEVTTVGGIIGTIVHVDDARLTLRTAESTRLVIERGKVSSLVSAGKEGEG
ncbi:MAG: preprotein translocase subunit YajC [Gemmatimonadetes bacterium]|nr:preprotein translocase subunit YajC [Gemmatimonadota bacterium]